MKIVTVVGARPQFIKASVLSAELARRPCAEVIVHTGQHYDFPMSEIFFEELNLRKPDYFLEVGSSNHATQTGEMIKRLGPVIEKENPSWVVVFGDTNSTLAGALVASKMQKPLAHVEAGLRSFNRDMPEEINRIVTDHVSNLLLAPTQSAAKQLRNEGITQAIHVVGDLMVDLVMDTASKLTSECPALTRFGVKPQGYGLATVHRASNTDDTAVFDKILAGLKLLPFPIVFPVHPRTAPLVSRFGEKLGNIFFCEPLSYMYTVGLEKYARLIITDSGGMQKEAYALGVPCVTLRTETEWVETLMDDWNVLAGTDPERIEAAGQRPAPTNPPARVYGDGRAACCIADLLVGKTSVMLSRETAKSLTDPSARATAI